MMERKLPDWMMNFKNKSATSVDMPLSNLSSSVLSFEGKIRFINNFCDCCYVCETLLQTLETINQLIVGFDLEWPIKWCKGVGQGKTALIQMCLNAQICYLFHVTEWRQLPKIFIDFISHSKVLLVGVNIHSDIWKLGRDFGISVIPIITNNVVELKHLANRIFSINENWSLARLSMYVLKKQIDKSPDLRTSNWAEEVLLPEQLTYAATDAFVSLQVYNCLKDIEGETSVDNPIRPINKNAYGIL